MWDLIWSICCSSIIFIVFKLFETYKANTFQAIIVNYFIALAVGLMAFQEPLVLSELPQKPWFKGAVLLGVFFILIFNLMALTSQRLGVSVASVATKMSLVFPVTAGIVLYEEQLSPLQAVGIVLALTAVYFASLKPGRPGFKVALRALLLPALVFLGSGFIDTTIKYLQETHISPGEYPLFCAVAFGSAGFTGTAILFFKKSATLKSVKAATIFGGIALGIPNFFSIYFLLRALEFDGLSSGSIFTINNVGIVMLTTLAGIAFFKEKLSAKNWIGVTLAVTSILLISLF